MTHVGGHEVVYGGRGDDLADVVKGCDMALLALPFGGAVQALSTNAAVMAELDGKIVMDATNPVKSDWSPEADFGVHVDGVECAAEAIQHWFPQCKVVKVFNTVFADNFTPERLIVQQGLKVSTFVATNDKDARQAVMELANQLGFHAVATGPLSTARYLEAMAHLNIQLAVHMQHGTDTGFVYFDRNDETGN